MPFDWRQIWEVASAPDNVPIVALLFVAPFFMWYALKQGIENDKLIAILESDAQAAKTKYRKTQEWDPSWEKEVHTWPFLMRMEFLVAILLTILLMVWSLTLNAPLEEPSNPNVTMNPAKAPWYFLGLQEMLVYFDPWMAGVVLPSMIIVGLMAIPYIDTNKSGNGYYSYADRKFAYNTFQYGFVVLWVVLILLGTFLRGPNWNFFGPYEFWDLHKVIPLNNVNLSDIFWIQLLGTAKPPQILLREAPGILLSLAYFTIVPYLLYRLFFKKYTEQAGMVRYL